MREWTKKKVQGHCKWHHLPCAHILYRLSVKKNAMDFYRIRYFFSLSLSVCSVWICMSEDPLFNRIKFIASNRRFHCVSKWPTEQILFVNAEKKRKKTTVNSLHSIVKKIYIICWCSTVPVQFNLFIYFFVHFEKRRQTKCERRKKITHLFILSNAKIYISFLHSKCIVSFAIQNSTNLRLIIA